MSEETLSALFDGEATPAEFNGLLESLPESAQVKRRWSRLWLTREALRGSPFRAANLDFAGSVMAAIEREDAAKVVPLRRAARWQPIAGYALAASVGFVSLMVLLRTPEPAVPVQTAAVVAPAPAAVAPIVQAAIVPVAARTAPSTRWAQLDSESAEQLNSYLIDHSGYGSSPGMGGLEYARYAAHTAEYRPGGSR